MPRSVLQMSSNCNRIDENTYLNPVKHFIEDEQRNLTKKRHISNYIQKRLLEFSFS